jgi:dipeptidase E
MTMNRLDARARLVFHYAREEADRLGHAVIESEHLLLGLLREGGTAAQVLNASGLTLEAARHRVVELIGRFERSREAPPPAITALARRVMDLAGVEAANYQSSFINTGFVLLGMIHAGDGVAMGIINQTSGGTKAVRKATLAALQLPPDSMQSDEIAAPTSSLSGIVAVPADSVLARLLNRPTEQPAPLRTEIVKEPAFVAPKVEFPPLESVVVPPNQSPRVEVQNEDIPDSMLIDEAFEEVPPEIEEVIALPVHEVVVAPPVHEVVVAPPVHEVVVALPVHEVGVALPVHEVEIEIPVDPIMQIQVDETAIQNLVQELGASVPEQVIPKNPTDEIIIQNPSAEFVVPIPVLEETADPPQANTKATSEVLVAEVEIMPEAEDILPIAKSAFEPALTDSTDGLLISDLLESPLDDQVHLASYRTPELVNLSKPSAQLKQPPVVDDIQVLLDSKEETKPSGEWLESDHMPEPNVVMESLEPVFVEETKPVFVEETEPVFVEETEPVFVEETESVFVEETKPVFVEETEPVVPNDSIRQLLEPEESAIPVLIAPTQPDIDSEIIEIPDTTVETSFSQPPELPQMLNNQVTPLLEESIPIMPTLIIMSHVLPNAQTAMEVDPQTAMEVDPPPLEIQPEPATELVQESKNSQPALLKVASWDMVTASSVIKRQIIALGGGGFSQEPSNLLLDKYILETACSAREVAVPRVCFISTAAGDSQVYIDRFYKAFNTLNCQATHLPLFHTEDWAEDLEDAILGADVLYFSGGSTKNALALWQAWELEPIFKQAYEAGTVFTGVSAGAICWFEQFTTDSIGRSLGIMNGLGWLPGSFTPHYDSERYRKPTLEKFLRAQKISPGFAADDHAAVHFSNGEYIGAVASTPTAKAYHVTLGRNRLVESPLETRFLGD